ncbi:MAG: complex I subunit 5 family protein [Desulfuromonadales bacterium]|nr:complex I subunit 5 family protein [Desulfuromonadales bacterium]
MSLIALLHLVLLPLTPLLPLILYVGLWCRRGSAMAMRLAPWGPLPALLLALLPQSDVGLHVPWLLLGGNLGLDGTGRVFLLLIALLWLAAGLYARGYLAQDTRQRRFLGFFLLAMSGNLGLPIALNLLDFYFFFALMSFSAYGLVVHDGSPFALRAGRIYMYLVLLGEILLFVALVLAARAADSLVLADAAAAVAHAPERDLILLLLVAGFGIKAGMVPLHVWLPFAHPAAPIPASAVLSGAMIKAGLLGLMRFLPLGSIALPGWAHALIILGLIMIFFGVLVGLVQQQAKTVLAYSSISQMGFPIIGLGLGLAEPASWALLAPAVTLYALHHGLAKGALFLGVGLAPGLAGGGRRRWLVLAGLLLPSLALAGAPLTSGAMAKAALKPYVYAAPGFWPVVLPLLFSLAALGTTLLLARFLYVVWPRTADDHLQSPLMWIGWSLLALALVLCSAGLLPVMGSVTTGYEVKLRDLLWPLSAGTLLATWVWLRSRSADGREPLVPPGDLLVTLEKGLTPLKRWTARLRSAFPHNRLRLQPPPGFWWHNLAVLQSLHVMEQSMRRLPVAGALFLVILLLLLLL